jgi:hypothetical protein
MTEDHLDDTVTHAYWSREVDVRLEIESGDILRPEPRLWEIDSLKTGRAS